MTKNYREVKRKGTTLRYFDHNDGVDVYVLGKSSTRWCKWHLHMCDGHGPDEAAALTNALAAAKRLLLYRWTDRPHRFKDGDLTRTINAINAELTAVKQSEVRHD